MSLGTCKIHADEENPAAPSARVRLADKPGGAFNFLGSMCKHVIHNPAVWIPLAVLILATVIFWITDVDLLLSRQFYVSNGSALQTDSHWPSRGAEPWKSLYDLGVYPAWILGVGGLLVFLTSLFWQKLKGWRDAGLFFALMLALGPGLLINGILKPCWGRPRPNDTIPFHGPQPFLPVGDIDLSSDGASFPSGHASMGFYLMAPAFVLYRRHRRAAAEFFALGLAGGTIMGVARIVAGSHFASDVVWSAGIVYFTGLALAAVFHFGDGKPLEPATAPGASSGAKR